MNSILVARSSKAAAATSARLGLRRLAGQHLAAIATIPPIIDTATTTSQQRRHKSSILRKPNDKYDKRQAPVDETKLTDKQKYKNRLSTLLSRLQKVDTAALCDADKSLLAHIAKRQQNSSEAPYPYVGLQLMDHTIRPRNYFPEAERLGADGRPLGVNGSSVGDADGMKMIGVARTVQITRPNDLLAVLRGLDEAQPGEVLVVNTLDSSRAVAGGLFCAEAARKGLGGVVVDGKVRDVGQISKFGYGLGGCLMYSSGVTPYAGTVQSVGEINVPVVCGGVKVDKGDIVVGDGDGVLVGSLDTFERVIDVAENVVAAERNMLKGISQGVSLIRMTNFAEHLELRKSAKDSALDFRKTRLVTFNGVEHVHIE
mmetsp:Transcript_27117/g.54770  ORF Transcript_27117/g.54770 Transcript_27117/m.54770 type:complete len:371 (+) Transcript_27117:158-1270(+)